MMSNSWSTEYWEVKLKTKSSIKKIKNKTNSNKNNKDQIWHKNKIKLNVEKWNWKKNQLIKGLKI
jgi:hypothetical protein